MPVSLYDVVGLEAWLNQQGAKGLFPKTVGETYARFHKQDVPPGARFRLAAMDATIIYDKNSVVSKLDTTLFFYI